MLPTAVRLHTTHPDLYLDDLCPQCMLATESFTHLWECTSSCDAITQIAVEGSALFWSLVAGAQHGYARARVSIFPGPHSVADVIQGIVPIVWRSILSSCGLPSKKVQSIVLEVRRYLVDIGHDKIWK